MEGSCRLGAMTTAVVEGAEAADGTGSSRSKRDTAYKQLMRKSCVQGIVMAQVGLYRCCSCSYVIAGGKGTRVRKNTASNKEPLAL